MCQAITGLNTFVAARDRYGKVTMIVPPYWLDQVHSDYYRLPWGQNVYDLPWKAREVFREIYPEHPENELVNWEQVIILRREFLKRLSSYCTVIHGAPEPITEEEKNWKMSLTGKSSAQEIFFPKNTHFCNNWRIPISLKSTQLEIEKDISHTVLYQFPRDNVPNIIVFGSGLSAQWVRRDFNGCRVVILINSPLPTTPETNEIISDVKVYREHETLLEQVEKTDRYKLISKSNNEEILEGIVVGAIGFRFAEEITKLIPDLDHSDYNKLMPSGSKELQLDKPKGWISAKKTPIGSLLEVVQLWMEKQEILIC